VASSAVVIETLSFRDVGALSERARSNKAHDLQVRQTLIHWWTDHRLAGLDHRRNHGGSVGSSVAADVVCMITETIQVVVLQRILAVVQPHVVRLALIERAAVVRDESGEVQVAAKRGVVTEVDSTSAIFRHGSSFCEIGSPIATNVPWMIAESIQMIV